MSFLLDTNVISEWTKPHPNSGVVAWLAEADEDRLFLSVITLTELRYGMEKMTPSARKSRLGDWLDSELALRFEGRVLDVGLAVADACGRILARGETSGPRVEAMDALIAATAEVHRLTLVTRNVSDFRTIVKGVLDPWT